MNGEKADVAHNDPPYGMKKENEGVLNDNLNYSDLLDFNKEWISLQFTHLKENGSWYCWGVDEPLMDIYSEILKPYIAEQKATFRNLITWFKNPSGLGDGQNNPSARSYGIITEKCLFVMMGVQGFANDLSNWFEGFEKFRLYYESETKKAGLNISKICDLTNTYAGHYFSRSQYAFPTKEHHLKIQSYCQANNIDAFKKEYEEIKKEYEEIKKEYYSTRAYFDNTHNLMTNVWSFDRTSKQERQETGGHATPKPILLCQRVIKSSCPEDGLTVDFFLGSGSTMVAAHQLKRKCYGMELDPKYCQVIIDRMTKLDPTLSVKINGNEYIKTAD
jgi:DNA modification methylase